MEYFIHAYPLLDYDYNTTDYKIKKFFYLMQIIILYLLNNLMDSCLNKQYYSFLN